MRKYSFKTYYRFCIMLVSTLLVVSGIISCKDVYNYDDEEPSWLGSDIYTELKSRGNFNITIKLIDDLGYDQVFSRTGSKTLFVAKDSAYAQFFKSNSWGVSNYEGLSTAQKRVLLKYSILNNAYTLKMLTNYNVGDDKMVEGTAMRQETAIAPYDSLAFEKGEALASSSAWDMFRNKGIYLEKDNTTKPIVFFSNTFLTQAGVTDNDFYYLTNGQTRQSEDIHIFDNKVIDGNIRCRNGYVHVLDHVMTPPLNMAQYIHENSDTKTFSKLLDRFCVPYYDGENTNLYKQAYPGFSDSIFIKRYYASLGGIKYKIGSNHQLTNIAEKNLLPFDPGWNAFKTANNYLEADMAAMFIPTDEAMAEYFNNGVGAVLKARYGSWDNIPDDIILPFLRRHMRTSLIESIPSKFGKMVDTENYPIPAKTSEIKKTYTGVNGQVYITDAVYSPVDYISVYSPVLLSSNSKIMNWAINISETSVDGTNFSFYKLYLNSLASNYALFIPTDEYFNKYLDPISYAQNVSGILKYWYDNKNNSVVATVYSYDKTNDIVGDSIGVFTDATFLKNRLWNILDSHIVVGGVETGNKYFVTKGNDIIRVEGSGSSMTVKGGGDIENSTPAHVYNVFNQENGKTYFIDKQIQPALRSVYKLLSEHAEFSKFFDLLSGVPEDYTAQIFALQGIDYRIKFFNAFRYTIYVPTNDAITAALNNGTIYSWDIIEAMTDATARTAAITKNVNFLRYHFQDEAVFFGQNVNEEFQSATIKTTSTKTHFNTSMNKYYKLGIKSTSNSLTITMDSKASDPVRTANVITSGGLYNLIAKDYIFEKVPTAYKNIDGTGNTSGVSFVNSRITTSASAVIHQIDKVLTAE